MYCTACGASNMEDAEFCVNCGDSLSEGEGEQNSLVFKARNATRLLNRSDFLHRLFDFSFDQFFTPKVIKPLYALSIFLSGLTALSMIFFVFRASKGFGILALFASPLIFMVAVILSRIWLEFVLAIFRIAEGSLPKEETSESKDPIQWNL